MVDLVRGLAYCLKMWHEWRLSEGLGGHNSLRLPEAGRQTEVRPRGTELRFAGQR